MITIKFIFFCLIGTEHSDADFSNLHKSSATFDSIQLYSNHSCIEPADFKVL
jgi:hypothetical protein